MPRPRAGQVPTCSRPGDRAFLANTQADAEKSKTQFLVGDKIQKPALVIHPFEGRNGAPGNAQYKSKENSTHDETSAFDVSAKIRGAQRDGSVGQAKHVDHVEFAGLLALPPERGAQCALGKEAPIAGDMAQDDPLARTGEKHVVFPHDVAAANRRKPDVAPL